LFNASYDNFVDGARLLLDNGADVNLQDHRGWTALMVAAHRGHVEMVFLLLKVGKADTTLEDAYGKKALDRAHSSHISYLIAQASIENRMKGVSMSLNQNEYSPEGKSRRHLQQEGEEARTPSRHEIKTHAGNLQQRSTLLAASSTKSTGKADPRLKEVQDAIYEHLSENLEQFASTFRGQQRKCIEEQIGQEIASLLEVQQPSNAEDFAHQSIAEKALRAMTSMSGKLQQELFNFIGLRIQLAFAKTGVGIGTDRSSSLMSEKTAEDFFKIIERRVTARERIPSVHDHRNLQSVFEHVLNTKPSSSKKVRSTSSLRRKSSQATPLKSEDPEEGDLKSNQQSTMHTFSP